MESVAKVSVNVYKIPKPCNGQTLHVVLIEIQMLNRKKQACWTIRGQGQHVETRENKKNVQKHVEINSLHLVFQQIDRY